MGQGGQTERHCGKVRGHSDDLAPVMDTLGICVAGQVHDRRYRMRNAGNKLKCERDMRGE